jgi:hypothetical protein
MTTFQDPPPQSRRAVRQSERGEDQEQLAAQQAYSFDQGAAAPAAGSEAVRPQAQPEVVHPQTGRRAQLPATAPANAESPQPGFEPLTYVTQGRVQLPAFGAPADVPPTLPVEERQAPPPTDDYTQDSLSAQPPPGVAESSAYRVRDFSPEGRRSSATRDQFQNVSQAPVPAMAPPVAPVSPAPVDLEYHTQGVVPSGSHAAAPPAGVDEASMNHTLTRRELRELRAAQEAEAPALQLPEPIDALLNSGPIELPTLAPALGQSQALADAMAEFDLLTRARRESEAAAREAQVASLAAAPAVVVAQPPVFQPSELQPSELQPPRLVEPPAPAPAGEPFTLAPVSGLVEFSRPSVPMPAAPVSPFGVLMTPEQFAQAPHPDTVPTNMAPPTGPSVPQAPPAAASLAPVDPLFIEPERAPSTRPIGHWSVQAEMDDDDGLFENTLTRRVGAGTSAITTSALVLPSVPQASDLTRPLTSTGEILVTGSIDLPRSLGSTGAHPHRVDNSDYEDDPLDSQVSSPDSAPVRAIRAVSTHTSTRGVIESKRPQSNRLLTGIIITASVLVVGVVGLLVYAFVTKQLF